MEHDISGHIANHNSHMNAFGVVSPIARKKDTLTRSSNITLAPMESLEGLGMRV